MLPFSPDVKMIPAYFFSVSKSFLKEYPVILILIPASRTRGPEGGYPPDIRDVTDGICKLRKTYN